MKVKIEFEYLIEMVSNDFVKCLAYECEQIGACTCGCRDGLAALARVVKSFKKEENKAKVRRNISPDKHKQFDNYFGGKSKADEEMVKDKVKETFKNLNEKGELYIYNPDDFIAFLEKLPDSKIRDFLMEANYGKNSKKLRIALFGEENLDIFYRNMSQGASEMLKDEISFLNKNKPTEKEIHKTRKEFIKLIADWQNSNYNRKLLGFNF